MAKKPQHHEAYAKVVDGTISLRDTLKPADFIPHTRHVLVEPLPPEETVGMIVIPETHRKKQKIGWVRAINPFDEGGPYAVGNLVLFADGAGTDVSFGEKPMVILQYHSVEESEILGCFKQK